MFEDRYYLLKLIDQMGREVRGRKKLQKATHLVRALLPDFDLPCEFSYHHYGPYSSELSAVIGDAVSGELLEETKEQDGNNLVAYNYHLTEKGMAWLMKAEENKWVEPFSVNDEKALAVFKRIREASSIVLEVASTVVFLTEYGDTLDAAIERTKELKAHLSESFDSAFALAREIVKYQAVHQH